jgi:hypothetical protein
MAGAVAPAHATWPIRNCPVVLVDVAVVERLSLPGRVRKVDQIDRASPDSSPASRSRAIHGQDRRQTERALQLLDAQGKEGAR